MDSPFKWLFFVGILFFLACGETPVPEQEVKADSRSTPNVTKQIETTPTVPVVVSETTPQVTATPPVIPSSTVILPSVWDEINASWVKFILREGYYEAIFPEKPKENVSLSTSTIGLIESRVHYVKTPDHINKIYAVSFHDYPGSNVHSDSTHKIDLTFANSRQGILARLKGKLLSEERRDYEEYPGMKMVFGFEDSKVLVVWSVLFQNRMYGLHTETTLGNENNGFIQAFHDSFRVTYDELIVE